MEDKIGIDNLSCDEIILDPDKLSRLLYRDINDDGNGDGQDDVEEMRYFDSLGSYDDCENKIQMVLPAERNDHTDKSVSTPLSSSGQRDDRNEKKLPPVRLQKVSSDDLSWLDTVIKHNSVDIVDDIEGEVAEENTDNTKTTEISNSEPNEYTTELKCESVEEMMDDTEERKTFLSYCDICVWCSQHLCISITISICIAITVIIIINIIFGFDPFLIIILFSLIFLLMTLLTG